MMKEIVKIILKLVLVMLFSTYCYSDEFKGNVTSYGFEVKVMPGAGMISPLPPSTKIDEGGGKVDYAKKEPGFMVPPMANQAMAMVEAKNPTLDVKGEYTKWQPKIVKLKPKKKLIKLITVHAPKITPIQRIIKRNKIPVPKFQFPSTTFARKINAKQIGREKIAHSVVNTREIRRSDFRTDLFENGPVRDISDNGTEKLSQIGTFNNRYERMERSVADYHMQKRLTKRDIDLQKSIESIIAQSLKRKENSGGKFNSNNEDGLNTEALGKRGSNRRNDILGIPEVKKYVDGMKYKVNNVVSQAKSVLKNTGKIVHGLKKVINGAKLLSDFTKNAVKFAKYFSMEPTNATVDFFEEKAVIAVLEAQKAAADAKIAAVMARQAAKKARIVAQRIKQKASYKNVKAKLIKAVKFTERQAHKAEELARLTSSKEKETRKDAVVVDKALRKMMQMTNRQENKEKKDEEGQEKTVENESASKGDGNEAKIENEDASETDQARNEKEKEASKSNEEVKLIEKEINGGKDMSSEKKGNNSNTNGNETENSMEAEVEKNKHNTAFAKASSTSSSKPGLKISPEEEEAESSGNRDTENKPKTSEGENKTRGLEASELPELFEGGEDENEVIANDYEKAGYILPKEAVNRTDAKGELDKVVEDELGQSNSSKKDENQSESLEGDTVTNTSKTFRVGDYMSSNAFSTPNGFEREIKKVKKGPLDVVVTVTRRKLEHSNRTLHGSPVEPSKTKLVDYATYDPFNFKSLNAENHLNHDISKSNKHYIIDKEDEGRVGLSSNYDIKNSIRSVIPNKKFRAYAKTVKADGSGSVRSVVLPAFNLNPSQNYIKTKKMQRSFVPTPYERLEQFGYGRAFPTYVHLPNGIPDY